MRKMKDSGIEWIGEIPEEWGIIKNKYLLRSMYSGGTPNVSNSDFYSDEGIPFVSISDMSSADYVVETKKHLTADGVRDKNLVKLPVGTILYSIYATVGAISELRIEATISQALLALNLNSKMNKTYYKYSLKAMRDYIYSSANGNTQFNLNADKVWNFSFVFPYAEEQTRIADFLDDKCGKIDRYIETQRAVIEKLKAYKQAVITEAVTKGLDPTAPMKDSGNREVGFIPTHWKLGKLLYFSNKIGDGLHGTPEYDDNGDCYFINGNNLGQNELVIKGDTKSVSDKEWKKYYIKLTDKTLLISLNGTIGNVTPYHNEKVILGKSAGYIILNDSVDISYIQYYLQSKTTYNIFELSFSGTTIKNLSLETLRNLPICIMPIVEQKQIASYLKKVCDNINSSIFRKQRLIDKLTEYKKSLIYEAVTGKQEVF